jgi:hypothetical protein
MAMAKIRAGLRAVLAAIILQLCCLVEPAAAQRVITHSEASARGAIFLVHFEGAARCPASFGAAASGSSVLITLDCRDRPLGASASFDVFKYIRLNSPWQVSGFNSTSGTVLSTPVNADPFARVRLTAAAGARARSTITVSVAPSANLIPLATPDCRKALDQEPRDFVCHSDSDCVPTADGKPRMCSADCGNRCMLK